MRVYLGIDGNRIGSRVESALISGDLDGLERFSSDITRAVDAVARQITAAGGHVVFTGGDGLFAEIEYDPQLSKELVYLFEKVSHCTAVAGIGKTPLDAFLAIRLAKSQHAIGTPVDVVVYGDLPGSGDPAPAPVSFRGLIWLLGPGSIDHLLTAIRYHYKGDKSETGLAHCWLVMPMDPGVEENLIVLQKQLEHDGWDVFIHAIRILDTSVDAALTAVQAIYVNETQKYGLSPDEVVADITGGLKTMTLGMILACVPMGRPVEYVASRRNASGNPMPGTQHVTLLSVPPNYIG